MASRGDVPRVLLVCPGLDHAQRGFESFARECFEALRGEEGLALELIKGSGPSAPRERAIPTLRRDTALAARLAHRVGRSDFVIEHLSFALAVQPLLWRRRPDLVYFSEWHVGRALALARRYTRQRYRLLLCNGTMAFRGFEHLDHVQELTPPMLEYVLAHGADPAMHTMLPLGVHMERELRSVSEDDRRVLRARLELPADRRILLSVAALNRYHKRLDYVIEEVASIGEDRPFLFLAGQREEETPEIEALAARLLRPEDYTVRTLPMNEVQDAYRASDMFVLASHWEGLPRALIEAVAHGRPCIAHDYALSTFVLGRHGYTADLRERGALANVVRSLGKDDFAPGRAVERHDFAYERFSWDRLRPRYVELFRSLASDAPRPDRSSPAAP